MNDENRTLLWVVHEMVSRFASTFDVANHGYVFELLPFLEATTALQAIANYREYVGALGEECNWQIHIELLEHEDADVRDALERWLNSPFWHLDPTYSQIQTPPPLADLVIECLRRLGATQFWRVHTSKPEGQFFKPFYECSWDDFLIQTPDGFLFLHLAVSD